MYYLKEFPNHAAYVAFTGTSEYILPNVSYCIQQAEVHYSSKVAPSGHVMTKLNATTTSNVTRILCETNGISGVVIDGVEQETVETGYTFSTTGEHTVNYILDDPTTIPQNTFSGCSRMTDAVISSDVTTIMNSAFRNCSSLTNVVIPNSVTEARAWAFCNCTSLTSVVIPTGITDISNSSFNGCSSLTSVTIPNGVTRIGARAFYNCTSLSSIILPSSLNYFDEEEIFQGCSSLSSITCMATTAPENEVGDEFWYLPTNGTLYVPAGSTGYDEWLADLPSGWTIQEI